MWTYKQSKSMLIAAVDSVLSKRTPTTSGRRGDQNAGSLR